MQSRLLEIADPHRHLSLDKGCLVVSDGADDRRLGTVPVDDVIAVMVSGRDISCSTSAMVALAERGIPLVVYGKTYCPAGVLVGLVGHHEQGRRFEAQAKATAPTQKRLWASLVRAKVKMQVSVLQRVGGHWQSVAGLVPSIRSGDPLNIEAQAARKYWPLLFGEEFRRNQDGEGVNSLLNYGYAVIRAGVTRAIAAAGLHPSLGLHHSNDGNAMRLADDLMEPFRPYTDLVVWRLQSANRCEVTPETKRALVHVLHQDIQTDYGMTPVLVVMQRLATSLAMVLTGERRTLDLPPPVLPVEASDGFT